MLRFLTKYFVPHPSNDHQPHLLRTRALLALGAVLIVVEAVFLVQVLIIFPNANFLATIVATVLVDRTNASRVDANLAPLATSPILEKAAALKANDMAEKGYFAHTSPDGTTPWDWFKQAGYKYEYAGENLAVNFTDSEDTVRAWLNSPSHRANIMNGHFTEIGIGTASGKYQGHDTVFIVQLFGRPLTVSENAPAPTEMPEEVKTPAPKPVAKATSKPAAPKQAPIAVAQKPAASDQSNFIATDVPASQEAQDVLGAESIITAPFWEKLLASPRQTVNFIYLILASLVAVALVFKILVRIEASHPHLVMNGVLFLIIVSSVLVLNQYLSTRGATIF
ncbi:MAG TPA: CAP domain-containing protein [Candidatus Paceibacterota bacterium]|nr:CAP domain-containing protein [Candidatus Paceibacterota bacterium]